MVSRVSTAQLYGYLCISFQSRNRGSFGFKIGGESGRPRGIRFQSRNRGSFGFKPHYVLRLVATILFYCFNLVIEVLLVSRFNVKPSPVPFDVPFQSRNRGSFGFKSHWTQTFASIIKPLFQSRNRGSFGFKSRNASPNAR